MSSAETAMSAPVSVIERFLQSESFLGNKIDFEVLDFLGAFVLKQAFMPATINKYTNAYFDLMKAGSIKKTAFHFTEVKLNEHSFLRDMVREPEFIQVAEKFFEGRVGSDFIRIVKKDANNSQPVFMHQDCGYQIGSLERYSFFIALTDCNPTNGGLSLYPGTHHFGYLGDVGEIKDVLPSGYPKMTPDLKAGDILIMHSAIWHQSFASISGEDRVYLEVHIQSIDEPTTNVEICGERRSPWRLHLKEDAIFIDSRTQRLRKLYKEIEHLKSKADPSADDDASHIRTLKAQQ